MPEKTSRVIDKIIMERWCACENMEQLKTQIDNETEVTLKGEEGSVFPVRITIERLTIQGNTCGYCGREE